MTPLRQRPARRTEWLCGTLRNYPLLKPDPAPPQVSTLHAHLSAARGKAVEIHKRIAEAHGV